MTIQPALVSCATDNKACLWRGGTTWPLIVVGVGIHPTASVVVAGTFHVAAGYISGVADALSTPYGSLWTHYTGVPIRNVIVKGPIII
eukprot:2622131-Ditylum_brightwellii.AAC.1